jgi:glycosyltransferase involved in cell wall biosynthesis
VDTAFEVARRLPHRRFLFVQGAPLTRRDRAALQARVAKHPNVRFEPPARDMRSIYSRTSILLVPSVVEETFGRVVLEAQASGIPAVARAIGGLPEAVGAGGILIPREASADDWAASVEGIVDDASLTGRLSRAALANAARPEFSLEHNVARFLDLAHAHVSASTAAGVVLAS